MRTIRLNNFDTPGLVASDPSVQISTVGGLVLSRLIADGRNLVGAPQSVKYTRQ
jgi:hypothetical protein